MLNLCQIPVYPKVTYVITPVRWPVRSSIFKDLGDLSLVFFILFYEVREHQWYKSDKARFLKKISKVHKTGKNPFGDIFDNFCPYLCVFSSSGSATHAYTVSQNSRMVARLYRISSLLARSSRFLLHSILFINGYVEEYTLQCVDMMNYLLWHGMTTVILFTKT